jgi:phage-related protein
VAAWLFGVDGGKKRLVFDDEPDLFYAARVSNQIDLEQTATHGEFSIYFRCEPYAYGVELPYDAYDMASPTIMYRDLHSTDEYVFSGNLFNGYGFQVNNYGTAAVGPIIRIYNPNGNAISIKLNNPIPDPDETFFISTFPSGVLDMTIDMSNYLCYHEYTGVGGVTVRDNYLHLTSGSWFKLRPGYNNMFLFGFGGAGTVRFDFLPRFY